MTIQELRSEAEQLTERDRGELVSEILDTFSAAPPTVSDEEVKNRIRETDSGEVEDISLSELRKRLKYKANS